MEELRDGDGLKASRTEICLDLLNVPRIEKQRRDWKSSGACRVISHESNDWSAELADDLEHEPTWGDVLAEDLSCPLVRWFLHCIHAATWLIGLAGCLLLSTHVRGDDGNRAPLRFRAERPKQDAKVAPPAIEESAKQVPVVSENKPQAAPSTAETRLTGQSPNPASELDQQSTEDVSREGRTPATTPATADLRPVVYFCTAPWCEPCKPVKARIDAGEFVEFRIVKVDPPQWLIDRKLTIPMFYFAGSDRGTYYFDPTQWPASSQHHQLVKAWQRRNPGVPLPTAPSFQAGTQRTTTIPTDPRSPASAFQQAPGSSKPAVIGTSVFTVKGARGDIRYRVTLEMLP
jgi:thiol-disulfide isomerase/thioredoxin